MVVTRNFDRISVEEYLEAKEDADRRHEYVYGEIYPLAGASVTHALNTTTISRRFRVASEAISCHVYASDMKLRIEDEVFFNPDVMIACQKLANDYYESDACVIVEGMSKSTARRDTLEKRLAYPAMKGLQLYSLVDSRKRMIKSYRQIKGKWVETEHPEDDSTDIPSIETPLTFDRIYSKTDLS
jgi:Uma2 family endonuclease